MTTTPSKDWPTQLEIPGRVTFQDGNGELPTIEVTTAHSAAEIYLHGATVTRFEKKGEPPVLFLSQLSRFGENHPIRGGVPVIFPWFGPREGEPTHGFARLKRWELREIAPLPSGAVSLRLRLPDCPESALLPPFTADYQITVADTLTLELTVVNTTAEAEFTFEDCLHTYFAVGDINAVTIAGLQGRHYLDKVENFASKTQSAEAIRVDQETDRIYLDATGPVEILDAKLGRRIRVEKAGSASTVVWNPWVAKAQQMPDFGNEEYLQMLCVESGNVANNRITLPPGGRASLKVVLSTASL